MKFPDQWRRQRVVERHHLARTAMSPADVVAAVAALHSSDPVTPYLAARARVPGFDVDDLEDVLYQRRTALRMHTIRRTLFVIGLEDVAAFRAGGALAIARRERTRLEKWLAAEMPEDRVRGWLERVEGQVVEALRGSEVTTRTLTERVPDLALEITVGSGRWQATIPVSSRVLFLLAMDGVLVRAAPVGTWRSSQYRWALAEDWLSKPTPVMDEPRARAAVALRYLETHGPVTTEDVRWWTGWTVRQTRDALSELELEEVEFDSGTTGFALRGDLDAADQPTGVVNLLPGLDPTTMGWKERDWYLGGYAAELFDTAGNAGPTVWFDGRVVGGWGQKPDGSVVYEVFEDLPAGALDRIADEAQALGDWLGERVVMPRFPSPLGRRLVGLVPLERSDRGKGPARSAGG